MAQKVNIAGLDKAKVLKKLWEHSHEQGMSWLGYGKDVTYEHAAELIKQTTYFDYVEGRVIKVDLSGDEFDPYLYDRDNFEGAAEAAISELR